METSLASPLLEKEVSQLHSPRDRQAVESRPVPGAVSRRQLLHLLETERDLIVSRYCEAEGRAEPLWPTHHLPWYLGISMDWAIHHLQELSRLPPGHLLDIGAFYGLIGGVAHRLGWEVTAVDNVEIPPYSSLRVPERGIRCELFNACVDTLPLEDGNVDVVLLSEVLEHLLYSPVPLFREIHRVLRPGGILLVSTPNPAALSRLLKLALGRSPLEPHLEIILEEGCTYSYKGLTFLANNRESKLWTYSEVEVLLRRTGLQAVKRRYYGNTVPHYLDSPWMRVRRQLVRALSPLFSRSWLLGGGLFVMARKPATGPD